MKIGDIVQWTSQSSAYTKTKTGTIVAVVPARSNPHDFIPDGFTCNSSSGFGMYRNHESYLVQVGKRNALYWPRIKHLIQ